MIFGCDINNELCLLGVVNIIVAAISMLGSGILVLVYLREKNKKRFAFKLVFYVMLTDIVFELSCFINLFRLNYLVENDILCLV